MDLTNRNVLITGATGGLGGAVVEAFVAAGAVVWVPSRRAVPVGARAAPAADAAEEGEVQKLFAALPPLWASVHLVGGFVMKPLLETTVADVHRQLDLNFMSAFLCTREAARNMQGRAGRIVNIASHAAEAPPGDMAAYASSKAAVIALSKTAAAELKPSGVFVNAVAPTVIDTAVNRAAMPDADHSMWAAPKDIASTILWLASPENTLVTGAVITAGG